MVATHLAKGELAEQLAEQHLVAHGYQILARNFRCKMGEIDLIARSTTPNLTPQLVFVEVKYRRNARYGSAIEQVSPAKIKKIIKAAHFYLSHHTYHLPIRFDVIGIEGELTKEYRLEWIEAAFEAI